MCNTGYGGVKEADWGGGMYAGCTIGPLIICCHGRWMAA